MSIRLYKSYTPGTRNKALPSFAEITKNKPEKHLVSKNHRCMGRNNRGIITSRHRGAGHKRVYRFIDEKRDNYGIPATVKGVSYDPNRTANIALVEYPNGKSAYILHPEGLSEGQTIVSGYSAPIQTGNNLPLKAVPLASASLVPRSTSS